MIHVEPSSLLEIDKETLTPLASAEFGNSGADGHRSLSVWAVRDEERPLLFVGTIHRTLASAPEFWVLLCQEFESHLVPHLRALRSLISEYRAAHGPFTALVREEHVKFAKFLGMAPTVQWEGWIRMRM